MLKDDNISLYAYALLAAGVVLASSWMLSPQQIEVAALRVDAIETGAIDTGSIPTARRADEAEAWGAPEIPWRGYSAGMREMARTNKPGVLVLQADWCLVCRHYQKQFRRPEMREFADDYVFILADVEADAELQRRYDVDGDYIPRTFVLAPDGGLAQEATGTHERQKFFVDPFRPDELTDLLERSR